jgi:hypothetical protein
MRKKHRIYAIIFIYLGFSHDVGAMDGDAAGMQQEHPLSQACAGSIAMNCSSFRSRPQLAIAVPPTHVSFVQSAPPADQPQIPPHTIARRKKFLAINVPSALCNF